MMKRAFVFASAFALTASIVSIAAPASAAGSVCPKPMMGKEYIPGTCVFQRANGNGDTAKGISQSISRDKANQAAKAASDKAARDAARLGKSVKN